MTAQLYYIRPAVYAPAILAAFAIGLALVLSWWWLAALPFIFLGSVCAQPNMNFTDGFLAHLAMLIGLIVLTFCPPAGIAVFSGTLLSYVASVIEKKLRMRPATESELW